jgi:hypothetical protein
MKGWLHSDQLLSKEGVIYTVRVSPIFPNLFVICMHEKLWCPHPPKPRSSMTYRSTLICHFQQHSGVIEIAWYPFTMSPTKRVGRRRR